MEVCTIIAKNYLAHARVLGRSLAEHNPGSRLWTLIIDDFAGYIDPEAEPFEVLTPADIGCQPFPQMALRYSVLELSTAVKPWLLRHLMPKVGGPVTYLDPDIQVFGSLDVLEREAREHGLALIPHNKDPIPPDGRQPSQVDVMIAGVYNLGYVSLAPRPEIDRLLDWWADRLRRDCRVDPLWGYFVDQRWFDLVPGFVSDLAIIREPEFNLAYWNLHNRRLEHDGTRYVVDGRPLAFYHFSGFDPARPLALSRHQNRIDVTQHPVLERLLREYSAALMNEGHAVSRTWPYTYVALGDGTQIDDLVRDLFQAFDDESTESGALAPSPFTVAGAEAFHAWLAGERPDGPPGVGRVLARVYERRRDLQHTFPDLYRGDAARLVRWARTDGAREIPLLGRVMGVESNGRSTVNNGSPPPRGRTASAEPLLDHPWGVNVVAPFNATGDAGEAARKLVSVLDAAGIPVAPVTDPTGHRLGQVIEYPALEPDDAPYPVNVISLPARDISELVVQVGQPFFGGRYSVGLFVTDGDGGVPDIFQEVWTPSCYLTECLHGVIDVPASTMPLPAAARPFPVLERTALGLPDDGFLFMLCLAAGDDLRDKNHVGAMDAFRAAFEPGQSAHMAVCVAGLDDGGDDCAELAAAARERGVHLVPLPAGASARLGALALCDCYVSIHRAEPFPYAIAEAMWLGKPVVATAGSGNMDFMTDTNGFLVDAVPLSTGIDDRRTRAALRFEPSLAHATSIMRSVAGDPAGASARGAQASRDVAQGLSIEACAARLVRRIEAIRATGSAPPPAVGRAHEPESLLYVRGLVARGPAPGPRPGTAQRLRGRVRKAMLRLFRPYTEYQQSVNLAFLDLIGAHVETPRVERAQLISELRGNRELREALAGQAQGLEDVRRLVTLGGDRALYLALAELGRRHGQIGTAPADASADTRLTGFELRGFSQNGEDGVLAEILRRVGVGERFFVEFGVESGQEGNCVYLSDMVGWNGLFMESDDRNYRLLERKYQPRDEIRTVHTNVTPENIENLLAQADVPPELDVLSIDVDGQDYWIWQAINSHRPRVVVIEYNSNLDPRRRLVQPRDVQSWDGTDYFGASLGAVESLGRSKGYQLVHTELAGANAFFVRGDLAGERFPKRDEVHVRGLPNYFQSGYRHPPDRLGRRYQDLDTGELVAIGRAPYPESGTQIEVSPEGQSNHPPR